MSTTIVTNGIPAPRMEDLMASMISNNYMYGNNIMNVKQLILNFIKDIAFSRAKDSLSGINLRWLIILSFIMLGLIEFKDSIKSTIASKSKELFDYLMLVNYTGIIKSFLAKIYNLKHYWYLLMIKKNNVIPDNSQNQTDQIYNYIYEWKITEQFLYSLYYFIMDKKHNYITKFTNIETKSLQETNILLNFDDICIKYNNYIISIKTPLTYEINLIKNIPTSAVATDKKTYLDLFAANDIIYFVEKIYKYLFDIYAPNLTTIQMIEKLSTETLSASYPQPVSTPYISPFNVKEFIDLDILCMDVLNSYPYLDRNTTWLFMYIFDMLMFQVYGKTSIIFASGNCNQNYFNPINKSTKSTINWNTYKYFRYNKKSGSITEYANTIRHKYNMSFRNVECFEFINDKYIVTLSTKNDDENQINKSIKNNNIKISISSQNEIDTNEQIIIISNLIKTINNYDKADTSKIKTFDLGMQRSIEYIKKTNPEYIEWQAKKNRIESLNKPTLTQPLTNNNPSNDNKEISESKLDPPQTNKHSLKLMNTLMFSMPPETIDAQEEKCTIYCNQINEDYTRTLDTLYLQKESEMRLLRILENFRDNKERMISLGIKHKLNILLHGLPGTGKTSTIHAVASYLKRDIYYLNLNEIKTNQELKNIFDHLSKTVVNGGIIVIEDIDAMTPVVLDRTKFSIEERGKNTELTLEFFLNILQGTLTKNDSIFIVTTNYIEKLDKAFTRSGRFDCLIELKLANHYQISKIYKKILDRDIPIELLNKIEEYKYSPADFIHNFMEYIIVNDTPDENILEKYLTTI